MQTQTPFVNSTCHVSGHVLNMHARYVGKLENPSGGSANVYLQSMRTGMWTMRLCWLICINLCMVSAISPKIFYSFIPPPTMTHVHLISLFPMLEQMLINIPSSHANVLHFWNSLPATPAQAPSSRPSKPLMAVSVVS